MKNTFYKYDVAFAFLQRDEPLAYQINYLIKDRFSTFLYSKKQENLTDADIEIKFSDAFGKQSRVVIVLYRNKWGTTPWTAIEEKTIRNRASEQGFDFVLFIQLDETDAIPKYLPQSRLWKDISKSGVRGAANVIEELVLSLGGGIKEDMPIILETEAKNEPNFEVEKSKFLEAVSGLEIAELELKKLFNALENEKKRITETDKNINLTIKKDQRNFILSYGNFSIRFYLQSKSSNLLMDSPLYFEIQKREGLSGELNILDVEEYHFEMKKVGVYGWIKNQKSDSFISSKQLAEESISKLFNQTDN